MNVPELPSVAVRPMRRADVDAFASWGRYRDPLDAAYDLPALDRHAADAFWRHLSSRPSERRPFAGLVDGRFAAQLLLRPSPEPHTGDIGIALDPMLQGQGIGRRILWVFAQYLYRTQRLRCLTLDVAAYNLRARRAYQAVGFTVREEWFGSPDPGIDVGALVAGPDGARLAGHVAFREGSWQVRNIRMECPLAAETFAS
jgi:RimJ/RimL family protein N-acetyltransferase